MEVSRGWTEKPRMMLFISRIGMVEGKVIPSESYSLESPVLNKGEGVFDIKGSSKALGVNIIGPIRNGNV